MGEIVAIDFFLLDDVLGDGDGLRAAAFDDTHDDHDYQ